MTDLLVKLFVKDYRDIKNAKVRTAYGLLTGMVGIICNLILFATKLMIGMILNSISVMADAFNNLSDAASSIVSFVGVKLAQRPADKEHPFGHGRFEYIAAFIVSFLVLQVGLTCFKSSFTKILHPETVGFSLILVGILTLSVLIKVWLSLLNRKLGKRINSSVMKATATDALGDVLITSTTILSVIIGKVTGLAIDGYMGAIVSIFVLIAGFNIAKETLEPLLGEAIGRETYEEITKKVESYNGILGCHDLIIHNYGPSHMMGTIHVEVSNSLDLTIAHEIIDHIERDILRDMNIFLVIHMDPVETKNHKVLAETHIIKEKIFELEPNAAIHDFRIVEEHDKKRLIFDMEIPYSYDEKKKKLLLRKIEDMLYAMDENYETLITVDNSYIAD